MSEPGVITVEEAAAEIRANAELAKDVLIEVSPSEFVLGVLRPRLVSVVLLAMIFGVIVGGVVTEAQVSYAYHHQRLPMVKCLDLPGMF
jgi:hypothetical protein